jgi:hypothetical protein
LDTPLRGEMLPLYSRDQTHPQTGSRSKRR